MIDEKEIERVKEGETLPLLSDTMFKAAFIKNPNVLFKMIRDIFELDNESPSVTMIGYETVTGPKKKSYRGDILIKLSDYSYVMVEMNNKESDSVLERNFMQLVRVHSQVLTEGLEDEKLKEYRMMSLNLNYLINREKPPVEMHAICDLQSMKVSSFIYTICNINIEKCQKLVYNVDIRELPKAVRWGAILVENKLDNISHVLGDDMISMEEKEKFMDTLRELSDDEKVLKDWIVEDNQRWREQGERRYAIKQGHEEGFKQGREEEKKELIINMLQEKACYDFISKVTGKTVEEIKEIEKNLN